MSMSTELARTNGNGGRALVHPASASMPEAAHARGVMPEAWSVLKNVLFKGASDEMLLVMLDYCKARRLDPLKKPFHIVQVYDREANGGRGGMVESIWPSIGELRTTAMRTKEYAGKSDIEFGPDKTQHWGDTTVTFPEWARCRVFRVIGGQRVEFAGSQVFWLETYASVKGGGPNAMWKKRPRGQLAKCAEAEALRSAFPEETGNEPTAEEMEEQHIGVSRARDVTPKDGAAPSIKDRLLAQAEGRELDATAEADGGSDTLEHDPDTGELFGGTDASQFEVRDATGRSAGAYDDLASATEGLRLAVKNLPEDDQGQTLQSNRKLLEQAMDDPSVAAPLRKWASQQVDWLMAGE